MFFYLVLISIFIKNVLSIDLQNFLPYTHNESLYITNNNNYNNKYYREGLYLYSIIDKNNESCYDSCYDTFQTISSKYVISITGVNIHYLEINNKCECSGQELFRQKLSFYPYILRVSDYNKEYFEESDIYTTYMYDNLFWKYSKIDCDDFLSNIAKKNLAESITEIDFSCKEDKCNCSGKLLYLKE